MVGSGAVGGYFGGRLAAAGEKVTFLARGAHLAAMREKGLRIESPGGEIHLKPRARDAASLEGERFDLILLAVKAHQTAGLALRLAAWLAGEGVVLSLQNGVENEQILAEALGEDRVLGGIAYIEAALEEPGFIRHFRAGRLVVGELDGRVTDRTRRIAARFEAAGVPCQITGNLGTELWQKLAFNCALNGWTALTRHDAGRILAAPGGEELFLQTIEEALAVARASGIPIPPETGGNLLAFARSAGDMRSSMLTDLERGHPLEVEEMHGIVVRKGEELGVATPVNRVLYTALSLLNPAGD